MYFLALATVIVKHKATRALLRLASISAEINLLAFKTENNIDFELLLERADHVDALESARAIVQSERTLIDVVALLGVHVHRVARAARSLTNAAKRAREVLASHANGARVSAAHALVHVLALHKDRVHQVAAATRTCAQETAHRVLTCHATRANALTSTLVHVCMGVIK